MNDLLAHAVNVAAAALLRPNVQLLVHVESLGIAHLPAHSLDFVDHGRELLGPVLLVRVQLLSQLVVLFLLDELLEELDVLVEDLGALLQGLDVSMEGSTLSDSTVRHQLAFLNDLRQLLLHLAQCVEVLLLDLPVLDLDDGEVFLVFLGELAETLGVAASLLREQLLRVLGFVLGGIQKLV